MPVNIAQVLEQSKQQNIKRREKRQKQIKLKVGTSASFYMYCVFMLCCMLLAFYNK